MTGWTSNTEQHKHVLQALLQVQHTGESLSKVTRPPALHGTPAHAVALCVNVGPPFLFGCKCGSEGLCLTLCTGRKKGKEKETNAGLIFSFQNVFC